MVDTPKISIIMPVFNLAELLPDCFNSILSQTLQEIEIICVNDGSTDRSLEILNEYAAKDSRILVLTQKNSGAGPARNHGLASAHGRYIAFMDGDDFYPANDTLEQMYQAAISHQVSVVGGYRSLFQEEQVSVDINDPLYKIAETHPSGYLTKYEELQFDFNYQCYIFDRQMLVDNHITFPDYLRFQDPPFFVKAMVTAQTLYLLPISTYIYRWGHQNIHWTARKTNDLVKGHIDNLIISKKYHLEKLHTLTAQRFGNRYQKIIENGLTWDNLLLYSLVIYAYDMVDFEIIENYNGKPTPHTLPIIDSVQKKLASLLTANCINNVDSLFHAIEMIIQNHQKMNPEHIDNIINSIVITLSHIYVAKAPVSMRKTLCSLLKSEEFRQLHVLDREDSFYSEEALLSREKLNNIIPSYDFKKSLDHIKSDKNCHALFNCERQTPVKVSVIIPVYNVERYLSECLDSVLNNTLKDLEIICMDDGSPDGCLQILKEYSSKYTNIKVLQQNNAGLSASRNRCLEIACGEYIHFLDSDDTVKPDTYEKLYQTASDNKLDLLFFDGESFYETEELAKQYTWYQNSYEGSDLCNDILSGQDYYVKANLNKSFRMSPCMFFIRRQFIRENQLEFPEGILHEDNFFTNAATLIAAKASHITEPFYNRRIRDGSLTIQSKRFHHAYGYFSCYLLLKDFASEHSLNPLTKEIVAIKLQEMINNAKSSYSQIDDSTEKSFYLALEDKESLLFYLFIAEPIQRNVNVIERSHYLYDRLYQTFEEKSEINRKLQITYKEKAQRGLEIKDLKRKNKELQTKLNKEKARYNTLKTSRTYLLGYYLLYPIRILKRLCKSK